MTSNWNRLAGTSLAGRYALHQWLGEAEGAAFFRTSFGPEGQSAALKLVPPTSSAASEEQLKLWRIAARISHPNMLRLLDYGRTEDAGEAFLYAVFEFPDDSLATALDRGPLSAEEAREVLVATLEGLRYIHSEGLVHAAVDPYHVVAIGNQIKLSTDTLRLPSREATTAEDVRSLGALVYQLIGGRRVEPGFPPDLSSIPEPFRNIIQHCLSQDPNERWSLAEITVALNPAPPQNLASLEPARLAPPIPSRPFPKWIFVATPVFLIALILLFRGITPKSESASPMPPVVPSPVASSPSWRVIAFTYSRRADADRKAESINRKWSAARADVFESSTSKSEAYLVTLGGPMSRDEAFHFLKAARSQGMPRATYVRSLP